jgi:bifunctional non-homologous end joining protein LigD
MQPILVPPDRFPFSQPGWFYEVKWDGYRALCYYPELKFISRNQNELNFPELKFKLKTKAARSAVLDGEITAIDEDGRPCFDQLRRRRRTCAVVYYAFDLLFLNGEDVRSLPLTERKFLLRRIIADNSRVRFVDHTFDGTALFCECERLGLEGVVAKRANSVYTEGRSRDWLKIKTAAGRETMRLRSEAWDKR